MPARTQIKPQKKTHYMKRKKAGQFQDMQNIYRCIRQDMARQAKTKAKPGRKYLGD